jgi:adenylate cyclase
VPNVKQDIGRFCPGVLASWTRQTVLVVDVIESVRSMEQDQAGFVSRWLVLVDQVKTQVLPQHGGRLVKSLGDGLLMTFDDVRSAASAALAIQRACVQMNLRRPHDLHIRLRMGMEVADVLVDSNDIHGHGVNLAARLMGLAGENEIVVTQNVRDRLTHDLDADIEDLGDCFLRHVTQPVRAYRLAPRGSQPPMRRMVSLDQLAPSIAVLPFTSRCATEQSHIVGDVIADEIIKALSHTPELNVISRLSTAAFKGRTVVLPEVIAHLDPDYVMHGSFNRDDRRVMIDVELVEACSRRVILAQRFEDDAAAVLAGEQAMIRQLAADTGAAITQRELQRAKVQPLATLRACTLLIGAVTLLHRLSPHDFEQARQLLQTLIDRGDHHPIPLAWLATWHVLRVQQGWSDDRRRDAYLATECTKRALDIDPECSLALAADGFVHVNLLRQLDVARDQYELALSANPSNAFAWLLKGTLHAFVGEGEEAVEHAERALRLTPLDPHRYLYDSLAASACVAAGRWRDALDLAKRSLRANRKHTSTLRVMAVSQWNLGQHDQARETGRQLLQLEPNLTVSGWLAGAPSAPYSVGQDFARALRQVGIPE